MSSTLEISIVLNKLKIPATLSKVKSFFKVLFAEEKYSSKINDALFNFSMSLLIPAMAAIKAILGFPLEIE